ncbi:Rho GTPase activation protein [Chlamydoabsidia padenii]|nr:Rho GTPase activation protein [Chlamydoabsidia padenii]
MTSTFSDSSSTSSSSAFSFDDTKPDKNSVLTKLADTVRDTRTKVEQKKSELNATMQERLPEWRSRGAMVGNRARETSMEWSRKGKEAVDRWKKDRQERTNDTSSPEELAYSIFGMSLEGAVSLTKLSEHDLIPGVLRRCINYLDEYGIHEVGIYRIPGSTLEVNKLRSTFDLGHDSDLFATRPDPNAVATLLKMYIRELPDPIIPKDIDKDYKQQINRSIRHTSSTTINDDNDDEYHATSVETLDRMMPPKIDPLATITPDLLNTIRSITSRLPTINLNLLKILCQHFRRIADNADENKMSTSNLALIFIPTLGIGRLLFHCMVDHYNQVFGHPLTLLSAGPTRTHTRSASASTISPPAFNKPLPPPIPLKPKYINMTTTPRRMGEHNKTLSDTDVISMTTPPPKPPRSPITKPFVQTKTRSKSVSSSNAFLQQQQQQQPDLISPLPIHAGTRKQTTPRSRSGSRVEAIGRQFEQLLTKSTTHSSMSSSTSSTKAP